MSRVRMRDIFGVGFWINYIASLALTSWVPIRLVFRDENGVTVRESSAAIYRLYIDVFSAPTNMTIYKYMAMHLGIVFVITALVWYVVARYGQRGNTADA